MVDESMPDGLTEEEQEIWCSSIPKGKDRVMNSELEAVGFDTSVRVTTQRIHDPKPLLLTISALRAESERLREALGDLIDYDTRHYNATCPDTYDCEQPCDAHCNKHIVKARKTFGMQPLRREAQ